MWHPSHLCTIYEARSHALAQSTLTKSLWGGYYLLCCKVNVSIQGNSGMLSYVSAIILPSLLLNLQRRNCMLVYTTYANQITFQGSIRVWDKLGKTLIRCSSWLQEMENTKHIEGQRWYISLHKTCFFFSLFLSRTVLTAYGSSWARGWIRAAAAGLHCSHSHSHTRSEPHLWSMLQLTATLDP